MKPSNDPKADQLVNSNISQPDENQQPIDDKNYQTDYEEGGNSQNG